MNAYLEARRAALHGLLIGDAMGVPYEFSARGSVPAASVGMSPPEGYPRAHRGTPEGTWSDDGAQALALLDTYAAPGLNTATFPEAFSTRLLHWYVNGAYTPDGRVFDVGTHTRHVLDALARGEWCTARGRAKDVKVQGNGSLMRCLPAALVARSEHEAAALARQQSGVTHASFPCPQACEIYTRLVFRILRAPSFAKLIAEDLIEEDRARAAPSLYLALNIDRMGSSGWVIDGLALAFRAVQLGRSYEDGVKEVITLGGDTDTNAAIVGGVLAARDGKVPEHLLAQLKGREIADAIFDRAMIARVPS